MRTAREVQAIVITEEQAQDLLARGRDRNVRVTPLKDLEGIWYLAPNVAQEMDAGKTFKYLDDHEASKVAVTKATILEDEGTDPEDDRVSVRKLDGSTEVKTVARGDRLK